MSETLQKLKKLRGRSLDEWRVRGSQLIRARAEAHGWLGLMRVPDDESFFKLIDATRLEGQRSASAENLLTHFRERSSTRFFAGLRDRDETVRALRRRFDRSAEDDVIERARRIREGRFQLLGIRNLDFGSPPDFHLEPVSGRRSPLMHWSLFDELGGEHAVDKKIVWELNRCQYFKTLGRAYWYTRDEAYAETFAAHLDAWMEQNPPGRGLNWVSSLEVALRAISWLWALYFFRDSQALTPTLFLRALKYLYLHGRHLETYLSTYSSPNTHLTGEALGLFYLGTLLPEWTCAVRWRETGERILMAELQRRHVRPDGVYFEQSSYYQRYTSDFYTHLYILKQANDGAIAPELKAKLAALLDHLMYITCPDGTTPFYGDDDGGRLVILDERERNDFRAALSTGAIIFARPDYKFVAGEVAEETLWLLGHEAVQRFDRLDALPPPATSRAFRDGGYYVMRDGWTRPSNYMLIDCGPHGTLNCGHAHADALSFVAAARGRSLLVDPGTFTYTGSKESRDYFRSSLAHNTLAVDNESSSVPDGPFNWKQIAGARARAWESRERFDFFEGEHDGYARLSSPAVHMRSVLFLKNDYWVLRDRVETTGAHRYELRFHFAPDADPALEIKDGVEAVRASSLDAPGLALFGFAADGGGAWQKEEGWVSRCYGAREAATVCRFSTEAEGAQEFVTFLIPRDAGDVDVRVREIKAEGGRAFEVTDGGRRDLLLLRRAGVVEAAQVASDCEWAWLRFEPESLVVTEMLLVGGRALFVNGQELFRATDGVAFEYVQWDGTKLGSKDIEYVRN
jgi:Heparinase II/III-like protein/Heparinase II/III N-terminus